ncbi:hypothetical protein G6F32_015725 [Rhizopus arrhizus]|nr:hypothetical protein G6F32_015725 [Rhizopus arrhizus]
MGGIPRDLKRRLRALHPACGRAQEGATRGGQPHAQPVAFEQWRADLGFQPLDGNAQGRLRHIEAFGRAPVVQLRGKHHELLELPEIHVLLRLPGWWDV